MWLRGPRRKAYSTTGGFLVTVSASNEDYALIRSRTHEYTLPPPHAHPLKGLDTRTHAHAHMLTQTLTYTREDRQPSLPLTLSAANTSPSPSPRELRTARLPPGTAVHLSQARRMHAPFMPQFQGHRLLPSPPLGPLGASGLCRCWILMLPLRDAHRAL